MRTLSLDTETTIEDVPKLRVVTICDQSPEIIYRYDQDGEFDRIKHKAIKELIESYDLVIIHNAYFDLQVLHRNGIYPKRVWCTMMSEFLMRGGSLRYNPPYKELVHKYCGEVLNKEEQTSDWSKELTAEQVEYCYKDVIYLKDIMLKQRDYSIRFGSLPHLLLKNEVLRVCSGDWSDGYPIDRTKVDELRRICVDEYRVIFSKLLTMLPLDFFFKGNITGKLKVEIMQNSFPYHNIQLPVKLRLKNEIDEFFATIPEHYIKEYLLSCPEHSGLISLTAPSFTNKVLNLCNVTTETTSKDVLAEIIEEPDKYGACPELVEILTNILKVREVEKVRGTYLENSDMDIVRPRVSYTVSGRTTMIPLATLPKKDDNKTDLQNAVRELYIPPKGYVTISSDFSSLEDLLGAFYFGEVSKVKYVEEKFDLYLLLAAKVFKNFTYTDASQTSELKKKYKSFRQAVKAISLAKNYSCGKNKIFSMYVNACKKQGIEIELDADGLEQAWASLYPKLHEAQTALSNIVVNMVNNAYDNFDIDEQTAKIMSRSGYDKSDDELRNEYAKKANEFRKDLLRRVKQKITISSPLGLKRIYDISDFNKVRFGSDKNKISVTELSNYTTQAGTQDILGIALLIIKKVFPSLIIPCTIHDSIVIFCPENGLPNLSIDDIQESIKSIMAYAGYIVYGKATKADSELFMKGF
jgi:hypothetical protein